MLYIKCPTIICDDCHVQTQLHGGAGIDPGAPRPRGRAQDQVQARPHEPRHKEHF